MHWYLKVLRLRPPKQKSWHSADCYDRLNVRPMLESNWPNLILTVNVRGLASVYSAPVVDCKIPAFVQCWMYNRPNLLSTVEKVMYCIVFRLKNLFRPFIIRFVIYRTKSQKPDVLGKNRGQIVKWHNWP